jgi:hypothetical protein
LKDSYAAYRNHCYRVYNLALHVFENELPTKKEQEFLEIAIAFHDIGVWTDNTVDYLPPSMELARKWLKSHGRQNDVELMDKMIEYHHKILEYSRQDETKFKMVERLRQADWIDLTLGIRTFHLDQSDIKALRQDFPHEGFYWILVKGQVNWLKSHWRNPFPYLRW